MTLDDGRRTNRQSLDVGVKNAGGAAKGWRREQVKGCHGLPEDTANGSAEAVGCCARKPAQRRAKRERCAPDPSSHALTQAV